MKILSSCLLRRRNKKGIMKKFKRTASNKIIMKKEKMAKTKFQIKNRYTGEIIVEMEAETLREVIEKNKINLREADLWGADFRGANLWGANLRGADLRGADLREADLREADLREADLWEAKIKITQKEDLIKSLGIVVKDEK